MRLDLAKAAQILTMLCEGMSVAATSRLTDTHKHTILDLLALVGYRCQQFLTKTIRGLKVNDVQCDEIWQFIYCKRRETDRVIAQGFNGACGDSWTFTAIERTTKLVLAWHFGKRTGFDTEMLCAKLRKKWNNHEAALGLYFAHYNFCRKHRTLKGATPAMASELTDHVWTVAELLEKICG